MRILLVSPAFHGYWHAIANALTELGHEVTAHRYDAPTARGRIANAVAHRMPVAMARRTAETASELAVVALHRSAPDAVLIVKGDALTATWWDALTRSRARSAVWLYDELERMHYDIATLRSLGAVMSYSPSDVRTLRHWGIPAAHLPDGFDSLTPYTSRRSSRVSFIGARYPERERLLQVLAAGGEDVEAYGREWSRHPWDVIRTRRWKGSGVRAHRDVTRADYYGVMAGSAATLNVHGAGHDGLSMRTFEAPGVGGLQLIDRPEVATHYDVGRETLVFTGDDELLDHLARARRDPKWAEGIRTAGRARTLAEHTLVHRMREVVALWD